jgi:hypothetical protein
VVASSTGQIGNTVTASFTTSSTKPAIIVYVTSRTSGQAGAFTITLSGSP